MRFTYCPHCGAKLGQREIGDEGLMPFCEICDIPLFDVTEPCIIALAVNEQGEAALLRQNYVTTETYVCVAGHIKTGETAEKTACREIEEELGILPEKVEFIRSYYYEKKDMLMLGFLAHVKKKDFSLSAEVDSAKWFPLEEADQYVREESIAWKLVKECQEKLL
nr:NUDIX domain-containing protein [Eubacterium sp.]